MTNTDKWHEFGQVHWELKSLEGTQWVEFNALENIIIETFVLLVSEPFTKDKNQAGLFYI